MCCTSNARIENEAHSWASTHSSKDTCALFRGGRGEEGRKGGRKGGREGGREERIIQDRGIGEIGNGVVKTEERKEA